MVLTKHKSLTPIGIDFDYNEFRAIQFSGLSSPVANAIATVPRQGSRRLVPEVEELASFSSLLSQRGFSGSEIVLGVPREASSFHILDLPPEGSGAPVHKLALLEAQRSGTHQTEDLQVAYWTLPPKSKPSKVASPYYTIACETVAIDDLVDRFETVGLMPIRIEPSETALARCASVHPEFSDGSIHSIIEIGWDHSWAVITLGNIPVYSRKIDIGAARIRRQLIDDHMIPVGAINGLLNPVGAVLDTDSQAMKVVSALISPMLVQVVDQLDAALTYVSQQHRFAPFGVVLRSGYFANLDQTAHAIAQRTGMPTIQLQGVGADMESMGSSITKFELEQSPRLNIAAGLSLGAAA